MSHVCLVGRKTLVFPMCFFAICAVCVLPSFLLHQLTLGALLHVCDRLPRDLCAKSGTLDTNAIEILNINNSELKESWRCSLYLFNVKTQQSCIPHALSRDPNRSDVAVAQSLMNHSVCIGQLFTVCIADGMGGFQNSLYLSVDLFCRETKIF